MRNLILVFFLFLTFVSSASNSANCRFGLLNLSNRLGIQDTTLVSKIADTKKKLEAPKILIPSMEWGKMTFDDRIIKGSAGGLGTVVQDLIYEYPKYLKPQGGKASFVFPYYDGLPDMSHLKHNEFTLNMGSTTESVKVYKYDHPSGAEVFFVDSPMMRKRSISPSKEDVYMHNGEPKFKDNPELDELYFYSVFNKATAELYKKEGFNGFHAQDYHTEVSPFLLGKDEAVIGTTHNGAYHGSYWPKYELNLPPDDQLEQMRTMMGVSREDFHDYFLKDGGINIQGAFLKRNEQFNLSSTMGVSKGYKESLAKSPELVMSEIVAQKGSGAKIPEKVYLPNGGLEFGNVDDAVNGLSDTARPYNDLNFRAVDSIGDVNLAIPDAYKHVYMKDNSYGDDLVTEAGVKRVHEVKAIQKEVAQATAGFEINPDIPLITNVTRMVDQKNLKVLALEVENLVEKHGAQIIIGGPVGDEVGREAAKIFAKLSEKYPTNVKIIPESVGSHLKAAMQSGADFTVLTPKFEPCGITDIEAAYLGTVVVAARRDGLGKVKSGFYYDWADSTDIEGEATIALRGALDKAITEYKTNRPAHNQRRIDHMKEKFPWKDTIEGRYIANFRSAAHYKILKELDEQIFWNRYGDNTYELAKPKLESYLKNEVPESDLENLARLLETKENRTLMDGHALYYIKDVLLKE